MNPRIWAFDLEMNQPSGKIIQVAGLVGDLLKGRILTEFNYLINCEETLNPDIIKLTGITQADVDQGIALGIAKKEIDIIITKYNACKSPVVWGNGDLRTLKSQGGTGCFQDTHRELDIKTLHQFTSLSRGLSMRGGLEKSLSNYGLKFEGRPHNALADAKNTFYLACKFQKLLSKLEIE
jgi:inhibitor of KinA sporulation pathway (predicted exonuclease)